MSPGGAIKVLVFSETDLITTAVTFQGYTDTERIV